MEGKGYKSGEWVGRRLDCAMNEQTQQKTRWKSSLFNLKIFCLVVALKKGC